GTLGAAADVLPDPARLGGVAALHGVDDDALPGRQLAGFGVLDVVGVVHVRRRVAHQEDHLERLGGGAPLDLRDRLVQRLLAALGEVAAALGLEAHEVAVDRVQVVGQVEDLGDVGVAAVAEGDQADLDARRRRAAGDLVADGPDLLLGGVDEAAHA